MPQAAGWCREQPADRRMCSAYADPYGVAPSPPDRARAGRPPSGNCRQGESAPHKRGRIGNRFRHKQTNAPNLRRSAHCRRPTGRGASGACARGCVPQRGRPARRSGRWWRCCQMRWRETAHINRRDDIDDVNRRAFRCWPAVTERSKRCMALASSAQSRRGCGRGGPSPGCGRGGPSPGCGRGGPSPGADVAGVT